MFKLFRRRQPAPPPVDPLATIRAELQKARHLLDQLSAHRAERAGNPMYRGQHYHVCVEPMCWSYLACDKPQTECAVGPWTCPCCEHVAMTRWADAEESRQRQGGGDAR